MSDAARDKFIPLSVPYISGNEKKYVDDCLDSGWLSGAGAYVGKFEAAVCEMTGARYAVGCASGTAALHVALTIAGVGYGDAVIVPTITFIASANSVRYCGADPVLIGCDDRLGLDPELLESYLETAWDAEKNCLVDPATGKQIKAVMPVHIFGDPCDMDRIMAIAERYDLPVIEDATESLGSRYTEGRYAGKGTGTIGMAGAFSFNGNKIVTTGGGGMIVTDDEEVANRARYLCYQAKDDPLRYVHGEVGFNYAMTNVSAAIGLGQMERLPSYIETKRLNRQRYAAALDEVPGLTIMKPPAGTDPNCWFFALLVEPTEFGMDREQLMQHLSEAGIQSRPLWLPVHMQKPYEACTMIGPERAVWYWDRVLNLPCSSDLTADDVDRVVATIKSLVRS